VFHLDVLKVDLVLYMLQRRWWLADSGLPLPLARCCGPLCGHLTRAMALDEMQVLALNEMLVRARELSLSERPSASPSMRVAGLVQVRLRICRS
jgi:hypothetical protein